MSNLKECANSKFDSRSGKEGLVGYILYDKESLPSWYKIYIKVLPKLYRGNKIVEVFEVTHNSSVMSV